MPIITKIIVVLAVIFLFKYIAAIAILGFCIFLYIAFTTIF